jgi:hypothetical protein
MKIKVTSPKEYPKNLFGAAIIILSIMFMYLILDLFSGISITFSVPVQEANIEGSFQFPLKNIVIIILFGLVHSLIIYFIIQPKISNLKIIQKEKNHINLICFMLETLLILSLMMNSAGHLIHWFADVANSLYRQEVGGYITSPVFLLMYASDEFLGHALAHVSYFVTFTLLATIELIEKKKEKGLNWDEWLIVIFVSIGMFILNGVAAKSGESGLILFILSILSILIILSQMVLKKQNLKNYPMVAAYFLGSIFVIIYLVVVIINGGWISYYPYIT